MSKFRKKPVVIEATQFWQMGDHGRVERHDGPTGYWIDTLEGGHQVTLGDWIITGVKGECYPCKPDIFTMTYEPVSPPDGEVSEPGLSGEAETYQTAADCPLGKMHGFASTHGNQDGERVCDFCGLPIEGVPVKSQGPGSRDGSETLHDAVVGAWLAGARSVHEEWLHADDEERTYLTRDEHPDFTEAAHDYAANLTPPAASVELVARAIEPLLDQRPAIDASASHIRRIMADKIARAAIAVLATPAKGDE